MMLLLRPPRCLDAFDASCLVHGRPRRERPVELRPAAIALGVYDAPPARRGSGHRVEDRRGDEHLGGRSRADGDGERGDRDRRGAGLPHHPPQCVAQILRIEARRAELGTRLALGESVAGLVRGLALDAAKWKAAPRRVAESTAGP
jgi:hypothetical protein